LAQGLLYSKCNYIRYRSLLSGYFKLKNCNSYFGWLVSKKASYFRMLFLCCLVWF